MLAAICLTLLLSVRLRNKDYQLSETPEGDTNEGLLDWRCTSLGDVIAIQANVTQRSSRLLTPRRVMPLSTDSLGDSGRVCGTWVTMVAIAIPLHCYFVAALDVDVITIYL